MKALEALASALGALRQAGTPLILLRERAFDAETAADGGDYDLLAPSQSLPGTVTTLVEALLEWPVSVRIHAAKPEKRLIVLHDADGKSLQMDLWREQALEASSAGRPGRVVHESLASSCSLDARTGNVLRLPPWLEVALYLCHLLDKKKELTAPGVQARLKHYENLSPNPDGNAPAATSALRPALAAIAARRMDAIEAARLGHAVLAEAGLITRLAGAGERAPWWWRRRWRSVTRRLGAGPVIAVQGPDGAGKTTIIEALMQMPRAGDADPGRPRLEPVVFKRLYRKSIFRWLYKGVRKLRRLRNRTEPKEVVETALSPFLFIGALVNYRLLRLFTRKRQGALFDRFFSDLLVTNRKSDSADLTFTRAARLLAPLAPRADLAVLLAAHPEVLRSRKAEMTVANASAYLRLLTRYHVHRPPSDFLVLRTDIPLERSLEVLKNTLDSVR